MAEPAVEQQVAVAAAHMPDVAAEERLDPRLVDQRDVVRHADGLVPAPRLDDRKHGHVYRVSRMMSPGTHAAAMLSPGLRVLAAGTLAMKSTEGSTREVASTRL